MRLFREQVKTVLGARLAASGAPQLRIPAAVSRRSRSSLLRIMASMRRKRGSARTVRNAGSSASGAAENGSSHEKPKGHPRATACSSMAIAVSRSSCMARTRAARAAKLNGSRPRRSTASTALPAIATSRLRRRAHDPARRRPQRQGRHGGGVALNGRLHPRPFTRGRRPTRGAALSPASNRLGRASRG